MYDSNANPPKRRAYPKPRNQLFIKSITGNLAFSFCSLILSAFIGIFQVNPVNAQNWFDNMPTPDEFKTQMDAVWEPIKDQYLPYGLGLMALGLLLRKL